LLLLLLWLLLLTMPTCLLHFCAEWRRARRVLHLPQLDVETKREVGCDGPLAERYGLGFWRADHAEAAKAKLWLLEYDPRICHSPADDVATTADGDLLEASTSTQCFRRGSLRQAPPGSKLGKGSPAASQKSLLLSPSELMLWLLPVAALPSRGKVPILPGAHSLHKLGGKLTHGSSTHSSLLFRNTSHPLSEIKEECTKDEFVAEIRKRILAENLFKGNWDHQPVASVLDAEDLFETLQILQHAMGLNSSMTLLHTGRIMDETVDRFQILSRFRQLVERDYSSIDSFLQSHSAGGKKYAELRSCFRAVQGSTGESSEALALLADQIFAIIESDASGKVNLEDLQRLLALVAPPRASLLELVSQLELRHGLGRCGLDSKVVPTRLVLFEHFCLSESLSPPPEDVARLVRAATSAPSTGTCSKSKDADRVTLSGLGEFMRQPPLEVSWGVEAFAFESVYNAMGCRALVLERGRRHDACLPAEALLDAGDSLPSEDDLRVAFGKLWDRCGESLVSGGNPQCERQIRERCFQCYQEMAKGVVAWRNSRSAGGTNVGRAQMFCGSPRSMFPNIADVIATPTCRLLAGQTCVVRYRLQGPSCFWPATHTVIKDERDAITWPVPRKMLGDTPFIGLVPRGLSWCAAGGGGFYLGCQAFNNIDPNLRADLPLDARGDPLLIGQVQISMPSVARSARGNHKLNNVQGSS